MPKEGAALPHLRAWRAFALLSQQQLAEKSGVAASTIARLERGERANYLTVQRLANGLGITAHQLANEKPQ